MNHDPHSYKPFAPGIVDALSEVIDKSPTLLVEPIIAEIRSQLQGMFSTPPPLILQVCGAVCSVASCETLLCEDNWRPKDPIIRGPLANDEGRLKMVYRNETGGYSLKSVCSLTNKEGPYAIALSPWQWFHLDLIGVVTRGNPLVSLLKENERPVPADQISAVNDAISLFRRHVAAIDSKFVSFSEARSVTPKAFHEVLHGFPTAFVEAMQDLADELAIISWHLTQAVFAHIRTSGVNTLWHALANACIVALIPGIRALAFHAWEWSDRYYYCREPRPLLKHIRAQGTVTKAELLRFDRNLNAAKRDALLDELQRRGVLSMNGNTVSVVEPLDFFRSQMRLIQPDHADVSLTEAVA